MKIEIQCSCGEKAVFDDPRGTFIKGGGAADELGRCFIIQVQADRWMEDHKKCREPRHD
jgi:hypothetical protein